MDDESGGSDGSGSAGFVVVYDDGEPVDSASEFSELLAVHVAALAKGGQPALEAEATTMETQYSDGLWTAFHDAIENCLGPEDRETVGETDACGGGETTAGDAEGGEEELEPSLSAMEAEGMSRTFSDNDDAWVLERILADRRCRSAPPRSVDDDYDVDDRDGKMTAAKKTDGREFLCKWRWYQEPTWEPESLLEEEGFGAALLTYLKLAVERKGKGPKHGGSVVPSPVLPCRVDVERDTLALARRMFGNLRQAVIEKFAPVRRSVLAIADIAQPSLVRRFLSAWRSAKRKGAVPVLLFHGTRGCNIPSIVDRGFIIPGRSGIQVVNGSAFGVGVYSATEPSVPIGYCDHSRVLFVCVGLIGGGTGTKSVNEYRIFTQEKYILPLWAVHFSLNVDARNRPDAKHESDWSPSEPQEWTIARLAAHLKSPSAHKVTPLRQQSEGVSARVVDQVSHVSGSRGAQGETPETERIQTALPASLSGGAARKGVTKKMLKKAPRLLKEYYKAGCLRGLKSEN